MRKATKPREPRRFDQTQCRESQYRWRVHRDYFAHCMRWSSAINKVQPGMTILDLGCGQDAALLRIIAKDAAMKIPKRYLGVDLNNITCTWRPQWAEFWSDFDAVSNGRKLAKEGPFDLVTNFEVIEHMEVADGRKLLRVIRDCVKPRTGRALLSTPVFNGRAARNHLHEYKIDELQKEIAAAGLKVVTRWGTFASMTDIRKGLPPEIWSFMQKLRPYHDTDVLACFAAPLYPELSRNICWELAR